MAKYRNIHNWGAVLHRSHCSQAHHAQVLHALSGLGDESAAVYIDYYIIYLSDIPVKSRAHDFENGWYFQHRTLEILIAWNMSQLHMPDPPSIQVSAHFRTSLGHQNIKNIDFLTWQPFHFRYRYNELYKGVTSNVKIYANSPLLWICIFIRMYHMARCVLNHSDSR